MSLVLWVALALGADLVVAERGSGERLADRPVTVTVDGVASVLHTDARGRFSVSVSDGAHALTIDVEDYAPADVQWVEPGEPLTLFLTPAPPLTIVVESFQQSPHTTAHHLDAEMALETPGAADDTMRLVQSLPGVTVQRELSPSAGELAVRGSGPGDNRIYLDGVELPYLYHFNQYASVLPTSLIGGLDMYSSTFGAQYGDAVGAVVEARTRDEVPNALHGHVAMNFFMVGGSLRAPLGRTKDGAQWWGAVAGRRSYQDLAGEQTAQFTLWPRFHDYHARVERKKGERRTALFAYGAGDRYDRAAGELDVLDPVEAAESPSFAFRRAFDAVGLMHQWAGSGRGRTVIALIADRDRGELSTEGSQRRRDLALTSRTDWTIATGLGRLSTGYEARLARTALTVDAAGRTGILVAEEAPALARGIDVDDARTRFMGGLYADLAVQHQDLTVIPGVRFGFDTLMAPQLPEPRLAVRWHARDQVQLKLAAGRYQQAPSTTDLLPGTGDPTLPLTGSWQVSAGVESTIANRLELLVDVYGKTLEHPLVHPVDAPARTAPYGRAMGVELVSRYRLLEVIFLRAWVAVARSQIRTADGWRPADGDQPVIAGLVGSWDIDDAWTLGVRYRYGSGQPYTGVQDSLYDAGTDTWVPIAGPLNRERLPAYQKVDVRIARDITMKRWSLNLAAELWYVPRSSAQLYPTYNFDYSEQGFVVGPTLLPLLSARATF